MNSAKQSFLACTFLVATGNAFSEPLNCSYVSEVVPDAEINYMEGDGFVRYELSYERGGHHWLSTAFELERPFKDNPLLKGEEGIKADNLSAYIAENAKALYLESGAEAGFDASIPTNTSQGEVITFQPLDPLSANLYVFHARRMEAGLQIFRVSGIALSEEESPKTVLGVNAITDLIRSCQPNER